MPGVGPIRTGVTAIIPHDGDIFVEKPTAAIVRINGFGEVTNSEQVHEMGVKETAAFQPSFSPAIQKCRLRHANICVIICAI